MHDYSIDKHPKEKILYFLAFIAIWAAPIINSWIKELGNMTGWKEFAVTTIPVFTLFLILYWLFNKYLWRISCLRSLLLVPDLNGVWTVEGQTLLKNGEKADFSWRGEITITQSWSKMKIYLKTAQSSSNSVSASMHYEDNVGYKLLYQYENSPEVTELEIKRHSGAVELMVDLGCESASGNYYTDQNRNTVGSIKLRKQVNV